MDGLVDQVAIDASLAYHHSKESSIVAVLVDAYDTFDQSCKKSSAKIVCCSPTLYVWLVSHIFCHESRPVYPYKVTACALRKGKQIGRSSWLV